MPLEWKAAKALSSRSLPWLSYWFSSQRDGFKAPTFGLLAAPVSGLGNDMTKPCRFCTRRTSSLKHCLFRCRLEFLKGPCAQQCPDGTVCAMWFVRGCSHCPTLCIEPLPCIQNRGMISFHFTAEDSEVGYGNYSLSSLLGKVPARVVTDVKLLIWKKCVW